MAEWGPDSPGWGAPTATHENPLDAMAGGQRCIEVTAGDSHAKQAERGETLIPGPVGLERVRVVDPTVQLDDRSGRLV